MSESPASPLPPVSSPLRGSFRVFLLGGLSLAGYVYWLRLSFGPLHRGNVDPLYVTNFLLTYAFLFACYGFLLAPLRKGRRMDPRHLWFAVAFGLLFRAVLLPSDMILEDDLYRYMWDGHVILEGENPYRHAPSAPPTEPYRTDYWRRINYPYVPTLYPPTLQYLFALTQLLYPGSVAGMKLALVFFDAGTIFLLLHLLEVLKRPQEWCLIYAWSPLVIKEIANSGHADSVSAFLLTGALLLTARRRHAAGAAAMALLTLTKFFGVFALPLLHARWRWRHYGLCLLVLLLLYVPFWSFEFNPFQGFLTFSREWQFNAGVYAAVEWCWKQGPERMAESSDLLARLSLFGVIVLTVFWQAVRLAWRGGTDDLFRSVFTVLGVVLLCSPVVNPWYLVWIVPLLCLFPSRAWIFFTGLVYLSYVYYYEYAFPGWAVWTEYGLFFVWLLMEAAAPSLRIETAVKESSTDSAGAADA